MVDAIQEFYITSLFPTTNWLRVSNTIQTKVIENTTILYSWSTQPSSCHRLKSIPDHQPTSTTNYQPINFNEIAFPVGYFSSRLHLEGTSRERARKYEMQPRTKRYPYKGKCSELIYTLTEILDEIKLHCSYVCLSVSFCLEHLAGSRSSSLLEWQLWRWTLLQDAQYVRSHVRIDSQLSRLLFRGYWERKGVHSNP